MNLLAQLKIPSRHKMTAIVNGISLFRIPLLAFCTPSVVEISQNRTVCKVRLDWRTGNHLGVMYFGALAMGAELSVALKAIQKIEESKKRIDFIFKDFSAQFKKRGDDHVLFICDEADKVAELIEKAALSEDRCEGTYKGRAVLAAKPEVVVMEYSLTLSVKNRPKK